ncbi:MAG: DUF4271 domain-containing protein [Prevotellaceae bacterium]|jgi:hypothetical protein|nr:DUF4271 domain-containing protein [Prevotellaceae bacterium]
MGEIHSGIWQTAGYEIAKTVSLRNSSFVIILLIISVLLFGVMLRRTKNIYVQQIKNVFATTSKFSKKSPFVSRKESFSRIIIWFLAFLGFAFFCTLMLDSENYQTIQFARKNEVIVSFFYKILITFSIFAIIIYLKRQLWSFLMNTFSIDRHSVKICEYAFLMFFLLVGLLLLFLSFSYVFLPFGYPDFALISGVILTLISAIFLYYTVSKIFFTGIVSLFYFFLYLCTLEILPFLAVAKLLIKVYQIV